MGTKGLARGAPLPFDPPENAPIGAREQSRATGFPAIADRGFPDHHRRTVVAAYGDEVRDAANALRRADTGAETQGFTVSGGASRALTLSSCAPYIVRMLPSSPRSPRTILVAAALAALSGTACGDGATGPAPTPNRAPTASGSIPALTVTVGETATVNVAGYFTDPDGDALTFTATVSNAQTASVAVSGSVVTVSAVARGVATVTVTATDSGGLSAQQSFEVTVPNQAPVATGTVPAQTVFVGDTARVDMAAYFNDPDGDALAYSAASSNAAAVSASVAESVVLISAIAAGTATITITATDPDGLSAQHSLEVTVPNRAPEPVGSLAAQTLAVGQTVAVEVSPYFADPDGDSLSYTAASTDTAVASATVAGGVVTVEAIARGIASVTVTATDPGGLSTDQSFEVTVPNQAPVVRDSIESRTLGVGEIESWSGPDLFRDPDGDSLTYAAGSSDLEVVRPWVTDDVLLIQGLSPGTATVTFRALDPEGAVARIVFDITVLGPVSISGTNPVVLLEGATATIFGSGFSSSPELNRVSIGGLLARVTAATGAALSIEVPQADCLPPRRAVLSVAVGERSDARTVGVTPRSKEDLELPVSYYRYTHAGNGCLHLPGDASGGEYVIGVVSTSEAPYSLTPVTMTSIAGDPTVAANQRLVAASDRHGQGVADAGSLPLASAPRAARVGTATSPGPENVGGERDWERHNQVMERNQEIVRQLGPASPPSMAHARQSLAYSVSDTLTLFAGFEATCSTRDQVRAVVRRVGDNTLWLDDIENPSVTFTDSELAHLDSFYAANVREVHEDYFGGLSDIDGNNRVMILMTKQVNRLDDEDSFLGGWVWFGDLYSPAECATSNQAEIFYGRVPDPDGVYGYRWTKQQALAYYPSLLTHEIAHLVQGNAAVFGGADYTTWELEGGATLSEQLVAYGLFGHGSGQNLGWAAYQWGRDWYGQWVSGLSRFFGWDSEDPTNSRRVSNAPEECSWMGRPEQGNDGPCKNAFRAVYDVPSVVLRYAMDRWGDDYSGGEQALMRRLTRSPKKGLASLAEVSGWRAEQILADFYISLWIDLNGGNAYGMATWDLDDIWSRLAWSTQLRPNVSTTAEFHGRWNVRAGSTYYLHWIPRGSRGPTALRVASPSGAPVPDHVSVWALRVR